MREDNETGNGSGYKGEGIRAAIWSAFGVGTAAAAKYVLGGEGGLFGGGNRNACQYATQRDLGYERQLTEKDSEIGQLRAEKYADAAVLAAERRLADKIEKLETSTTARFAAQGEYNVANTAAVASTKSQVMQLMSMTGLIINGPAMAASEAAASVFTAKASTTAAAA